MVTKPTIDKAFLLFGAVMIEVVEHTYNASCSLQETDPYVEAMYQEFCGIENVSAEEWLVGRLKGEFKCVEAPPVWATQPEWPYCDGRPMVFVTQYSLPETGVTKSSLTWDSNLYLFGARVVCEEYDGYRMDYRVISQAPE